MGDFVEYHKPCPNCGGSDPVSINSDGTANVLVVEHFSKTMNLQWEANVADFNSFKRSNDNNSFHDTQSVK